MRNELDGSMRAGAAANFALRYCESSGGVLSKPFGRAVRMLRQGSIFVSGRIHCVAVSQDSIVMKRRMINRLCHEVDTDRSG